MFGCMISGSTGYADQPTDGGAVDDGAAALLAHLAQLVLHAVPDAAEIDRIHAIKFFAAGISGFHSRRLHARIVEGRIQPAKGGNGLLDHGCHLRLVSHIASDRESLMASGD